MIINEAYHLGSYWKEDKITAGIYLDKVFQYLTGIMSEFKQYKLLIIGDNEILPFSMDPEGFKTRMLPLIYNDDAWYFDKAGNRSTEIQLDSTCDAGFYSQYLFENGNVIIKVNIRGGCHRVTSPEGYTYGNEIPNSVLVYFPLESLNTIDFISIKRIFLYSVKIWQPANGFVVSDEFLDVTYNAENDFHIGWINYFRDFPKGIPLPEEVDYEELESGVLLSLIEEIPESNDAELINKGLKLREILNQHDVLNWANKA